MSNQKISIKHIAVTSETLKSPYENFLSGLIGSTKQDLNLNKYRFLGGTISEEDNKKYILAYIPILSSIKIDLNDKPFVVEVPSIYTINPPPDVDPKLCLSVFIASLRIYSALYLKGKCVENEKVLILNSASCWGYLACQLASLTGCQVFAEVNSPSHLSFLKKVSTSFRHQKIFQSSQENLGEIINEETLGTGVDCVIDFYPTHTPESKRNIIESLAVGGRWVTIDDQIQLDLPESQCLFYKNGSLNFLFDEAYEVFGMELGKVKNIMEEALEKLKEGKFSVFIENEYNSIKEFEENLLNDTKFGSSIINLE